MAKYILLYEKKSGCDFHRIFNPYKYIKSEEGDNFLFKESSDKLTQRDMKDTSIVIFNRFPKFPLKNLTYAKNTFGFRIIVDIDDYWELYPEHPGYKSWVSESVKGLFIESMRIADLVTTTNSRLADQILLYNKNVEVIPNALPLGIGQFVPKKEESVKVRFLLAGGSSHYHDYKSMEDFVSVPSMSLFLRERASFILAGYNPTQPNSEWIKMKDFLSPLPNFSTRPELELSQYMDHYNHADVVMAPLSNNKFNTFKSNLRTIEAGCMRLPIVASEMFPYLEDEEMRNKGIFFTKSGRDFYKYSLYLSNNPDRAIDAGEELYQYVKEKYDLQEVNKKRRQILNHYKN